MYQIKRTFGEEMILWDDNGIIRWVPTDPANKDYQAYLEWLAEGNTALVIEDDA